MPKVSPEHMQARRDQIAHAAIAQFAQRGIHLTSIADIVTASELSAGAIYTHFTGKHDIIAYVAQTAFTSIFSGVEKMASTQPLPTPDDLIDRIHSGITNAEIPSGMIVQIWGEAATNPDVRAAVNQVYGRALGVLTGYSERWLATADEQCASAPQQADSLARLMISIIYSQILQTSLIDGYDAGAFTAGLSRLREAR
ncbi:MAG: TetR family transcriptional regulator [Leucobacter sp.]|nr:TetR family transcriptional regulator [Leucobacter sp.]